MKNKTKVFAIVLGLFLVLICSGCSDNNNDKNSTTAKTSSSESSINKNASIPDRNEKIQSPSSKPDTTKIEQTLKELETQLGSLDEVNENELSIPQP